ncbi:HNH endonuclease [Streptomyces sp. BBFR109]|uniref:HNH endonuclease n=1 Tax=Streptomyces sp. BBFR109 TaxID=3448172 RepID=UPI003F77089D
MIQVKLSRGAIAIIDDVDKELAQHKWCIIGGAYAVRQGLNRSSEYLHRRVMERVLGRALTVHEIVDHINGDKLDNRRHNLRAVDHQINQFNRGKQVNNRSGVKGVVTKRYRDGSAYFQAVIKLDRKQFYVGSFTTIDEAAWMRDQWAIALHGEYAVLNFEYV